MNRFLSNSIRRFTPTSSLSSSSFSFSTAASSTANHNTTRTVAKKTAFNFQAGGFRKASPPPATEIVAKKSNLPQSPWKMRFLVMLGRGCWVPDALAQFKFSPKHRATDVAKIVKRAASVAQIQYGAIPEELYVKEIFVNKCLQRKKLRIMGRGRHGVGRIRTTNVLVKVDKVDFEEQIKNAEDNQEKRTWEKRWELAKKLRLALDNKDGGSMSMTNPNI